MRATQARQPAQPGHTWTLPNKLGTAPTHTQVTPGVCADFARMAEIGRRMWRAQDRRGVAIMTAAAQLRANWCHAVVNSSCGSGAPGVAGELTT